MKAIELLAVAEFVVFCGLSLLLQLMRWRVLQHLKNNAHPTWSRLGYGARFGQHTLRLAFDRLKFVLSGEYRELPSERLRREYLILRWILLAQVLLFLAFFVTVLLANVLK